LSWRTSDGSLFVGLPGGNLIGENGDEAVQLSGSKVLSLHTIPALRRRAAQPLPKNDA